MPFKDACHGAAEDSISIYSVKPIFAALLGACSLAGWLGIHGSQILGKRMEGTGRLPVVYQFGCLKS